MLFAWRKRMPIRVARRIAPELAEELPQRGYADAVVHADVAKVAGATRL